MGIEIKILTDLEDPEINNYFNKFHNENRSKEAFDWEFCQTPYSPSVYIHAIDENNEIVGAISVLFLEMINGAGEKILTGKPEDVMVDIFSSIKHRNTDIFESLYKALEKECIKRKVALLWGFTYADSSFERLGFTSTFTSNNGVLVFKPVKSYKYLISLNMENRVPDLFKIAVLSWLSFLNGFRFRFTSSKIAGRVVLDDMRDHHELVLSHLENQAEFYILNQGDEYLKWRIHNNPNNIAYKIIALRDNYDVKLAEVIYSLNGDIAYIEQILYSKRLNKKHIARFLKHAISNLRQNDISLIRFMGFGTNMYNKSEMSLLKSLGFMFTNKGIPFIFKELSGKSFGFSGKNMFLSRLYTQGNS